MKTLVIVVMFAVALLTIGILLVRDRASREKSARLDQVCEHVREMLCLRLGELDQRPGIGHVTLPSNVEIDACAPGIWNDWKLGEAVKNGGEAAYDKELRTEVEQIVHEIPAVRPSAPECAAYP